MIFYLASDTEGYRQLRATQVLAKQINKQFDQIDIPVDKQGLCAAIQELLTDADVARAKFENHQPRETGEMLKSNVIFPGDEIDVIEEISSDHDRRCRKCHLVLVATERGAKLLAAGEDMTALSEWIDQMPRWAIDFIQASIDARNQADADLKHEAQTDEDLPFTPD